MVCSRFVVFVIRGIRYVVSPRKGKTKISSRPRILFFNFVSLSLSSKRKSRASEKALSLKGPLIMARCAFHSSERSASKVYKNGSSDDGIVLTETPFSEVI
jgi:hypothetical protein